jgi:hypothetical protein
MLMTRSLILVLLTAASAMATPPAAPIVTLDLRLTPAANTWQVYAADSLDNGGISDFAINLKNTVTAALAAPKGYDMGLMKGFTLGGVSMLDANAEEYKVIGGQSTHDGAVIWGVGQTAGLLPGYLPVIEAVNWDFPVLLACGTYDSGTTFALTDLTGAANVFVRQDALEVTQAQIVWVPEPMTVILLGLSSLPLLRRRR